MQAPEPSSSPIKVEAETLELKTLVSLNDDSDEYEDEDEEDNDACWGSYGRRNTRIKFPRPINFLVKSCSSSTYRRAWLWKKVRGDNHIMIQAMPFNRHECMVAAKEGGNLKLEVFEKDDYVNECRRLMNLKKEQEMSAVTENVVEEVISGEMKSMMIMDEKVLPSSFGTGLAVGDDQCGG